MKDRVLHPRAREAGGRLVVRYAGGITVLWIGLAVFGLGFGFATVGSGHNPEAAFAGLGLGVISAFVAWFAANPAIVADQAGIEVAPIFGTRTTFRWDEVQAIGVREVRGARGRGPALVIDGTDEREAKIDSLWVGATRGNLDRIAVRIEEFAGSLEIAQPRFVHEPADEAW